MPRPLMQYGVGQLEEMFAKGKADPNVLKQLEQELQYRKVPRAIALLAEVQAMMHGDTPELPARTARLQQPTNTASSSAPLAATLPVAQPGPAAAMVKPQVATPQSAPLPTMSIEDARKVLKTAPGATWESIEQSRRLLVQQSHPSLLKPLSDEKRAQALVHARCANAAYAILQTERCDRT